jgi:hypothetical protein
LIIKTTDKNVLKAASGEPVGEPGTIGGPFAYFQGNLEALRASGSEVVFEDATSGEK